MSRRSSRPVSGFIYIYIYIYIYMFIYIYIYIYIYRSSLSADAERATKYTGEGGPFWLFMDVMNVYLFTC
jgi:hypothetical protein